MTMIKTFKVTERTLMGPGPSNVASRVLTAMSKPTIGHLDPDFIRMMDEIQGLLQYAFITKNKLTIPISAPGSAGMETCFVNLLEPGDKAIVCINGVFGQRMKENVERCGGEAVLVEDEWGAAVDTAKVEKALQNNPDAKVLAFVHAETSTGALSDAAALCKLAQQYDCLTIVDAVTSLAGVELKVDEWGIDAIYSGTQKCLSCPPGISLISFNDRAAEVVSSRKTKVQSWFLDLSLLMQYWKSGESKAPRAYHHTAPVNALFGLHETLVLLQEEGLGNAWARHKQNHLALKAGLEALGLDYAVPESICLPQLNPVKIPDGIDDVQVRTQLLNKYNLEIGSGLGKFKGNVWRIGLMGHSSHPKNVMLCLSALDSVLAELRGETPTNAGCAAAEKIYVDLP